MIEIQRNCKLHHGVRQKQCPFFSFFLDGRFKMFIFFLNQYFFNTPVSCISQIIIVLPVASVTVFQDPQRWYFLKAFTSYKM